MDRGAGLIHAVITRDQLLVWQLADSISVRFRDGWGYQAMHWAAIDGNLPALKMMRRAYGIDLDQRVDHGKHLLHLACENGHLHIVKWLVNRQGVDPRTVTTTRGLTAFEIAEINDEGDILDFLDDATGARVRYVNGPLNGTRITLSEDGTHFRGVDDWDIRLKRLLYSDRVDCVVCPGRLDHYMPRMIVPAHLMPHRYDADTHYTAFYIKSASTAWSALQSSRSLSASSRS